MAEMSRNGVAIADGFAEAFDMAATALVITADDARWAMIAAQAMTGFATSVIGCGVEAGIDRLLAPEETPDGRPGARVLLFGFEPKGLGEQAMRRVGQCVLTCPGAACYGDPASGAPRYRLGGALKSFGDGFEAARRIGAERYWRIPVMDGEFICSHEAGTFSGAIGGGNLLFLARDRQSALRAAEVAVAAASAVADVILPFPGGVVRSGSKVGSRYKGLAASTNDAYCPTLKGRSPSALPHEVNCVMEIVLDGLSFEAIQTGMRAALLAATDLGAHSGLARIEAGNYGGKLGRHHFHLRDLLR